MIHVEAKDVIHLQLEFIRSFVRSPFISPVEAAVAAS